MNYLTLDTETCNTFDDPFAYDIGGAVHDEWGNVRETFSFVIDEVFNGMKDLMAECYFADKIPQYEKDIEEGSRKVVKMVYAKMYINNLCKKYNVKAIICHNARFDYRSTATTQRFLTKSKYRHFLPYGVELWDTLKMARQVMPHIPMFARFCETNGFTTKNNKPQLTAEVLYRWITKDVDFIESHTGLEDVLIEKEIFSYFVRQGFFKKIEKTCFKR